jgi:multidrug resistance efflux pump
MAEIMDKSTQPLPSAAPGSKESSPVSPPSSKNATLAKKKRRRLIRRIIILLILAAAAFTAWKYFGQKDAAGEGEVVVDTVHYDSITSIIENSGLTKAKNSETITITTAGTVMDVFVTEGQLVNAGDPLFVIDSPAAQNAVEKPAAMWRGSGNSFLLPRRIWLV